MEFTKIKVTPWKDSKTGKQMFGLNALVKGEKGWFHITNTATKEPITFDTSEQATAAKLQLDTIHKII